ncbi:UvrD-helicase domain-containing protein, partial [Staphylococcus aureus]|nr:UvrD-helicase domain-containing protein [Staphylococcus aureus]
MSRYLNLTKEQNEVINEEGNLVVTANPGSGKTLTIVEKILNISQTLYSYQGV